jgi:hypothetical protein
MKRALVAAAASALLITISARADESPAASASAEHVAATPASAVTSDTTSTTTAARSDKAAVRKSRHSSADDAANKSEALEVKQVPLRAPSDTTMCRTEYPTGSRIGVRRCSSTTETARDKVRNDIMRHDIEEMRDRQMYEQVQRATVGMGVPPAIQSTPTR